MVKYFDYWCKKCWYYLFYMLLCGIYVLGIVIYQGQYRKPIKECKYHCCVVVTQDICNNPNLIKSDCWALSISLGPINPKSKVFKGVLGEKFISFSHFSDFCNYVCVCVLTWRARERVITKEIFILENKAFILGASIGALGSSSSRYTPSSLCLRTPSMEF